MILISVNEKLPINDKFRLVECENGLHICRYLEKDNEWWDREGWKFTDVTHWQPLLKELN